MSITSLGLAHNLQKFEAGLGKGTLRTQSRPRVNRTLLKRPTDLFQPNLPRALTQHTACPILSTSAMSAQRILYDELEGVEDLSYYKPQGYHVVHLGDVFENGRYQVINKLGHGSFSTVWLAHDTHSQRCVALKILLGTKTQLDFCFETDLATRLDNRDGNFHLDDGQEFVLIPLHVFDILGPNGTHKCLVLPLTGPSIYYQSEYSIPSHLPLVAAKRAIWQVTKGLEYLHRSRIGHGGKCSRYRNAEIPLKQSSWNQPRLALR